MLSVIWASISNPHSVTAPDSTTSASRTARSASIVVRTLNSAGWFMAAQPNVSRNLSSNDVYSSSLVSWPPKVMKASDCAAGPQPRQPTGMCLFVLNVLGIWGQSCSVARLGSRIRVVLQQSQAIRCRLRVPICKIDLKKTPCCIICTYSRMNGSLACVTNRTETSHKAGEPCERRCHNGAFCTRSSNVGIQCQIYFRPELLWPSVHRMEG